MTFLAIALIGAAAVALGLFMFRDRLAPKQDGGADQLHGGDADGGGSD